VHARRERRQGLEPGIDVSLDIDHGQMSLFNLGNLAEGGADCVGDLFRNRLSGRSDVNRRTTGDFHIVLESNLMRVQPP
jgi:hypothetical protein